MTNTFYNEFDQAELDPRDAEVCPLGDRRTDRRRGADVDLDARTRARRARPRPRARRMAHGTLVPTRRARPSNR